MSISLKGGMMKDKQAGFTLIEVIVALSVLVIALGTLVIAQIGAAKLSSNSRAVTDVTTIADQRLEYVSNWLLNDVENFTKYQGACAGGAGGASRGCNLEKQEGYSDGKLDIDGDGVEEVVVVSSGSQQSAEPGESQKSSEKAASSEDQFDLDKDGNPEVFLGYDMDYTLKGGDVNLDEPDIYTTTWLSYDNTGDGSVLVTVAALPNPELSEQVGRLDPVFLTRSVSCYDVQWETKANAGDSANAPYRGVAPPSCPMPKAEAQAAASGGALAAAGGQSSTNVLTASNPVSAGGTATPTYAASAAGAVAGTTAGGVGGALVGLAAGAAVGAVFGGVGAIPGAMTGANIGSNVGSELGGAAGYVAGSTVDGAVNTATGASKPQDSYSLVANSDGTGSISLTSAAGQTMTLGMLSNDPAPSSMSSVALSGDSSGNNGSMTASDYVSDSSGVYSSSLTQTDTNGSSSSSGYASYSPSYDSASADTDYSGPSDAGSDPGNPYYTPTDYSYTPPDYSDYSPVANDDSGEGGSLDTMYYAHGQYNPDSPVVQHAQTYGMPVKPSYYYYYSPEQHQALVAANPDDFLINLPNSVMPVPDNMNVADEYLVNNASDDSAGNTPADSGSDSFDLSNLPSAGSASRPTTPPPSRPSAARPSSSSGGGGSRPPCPNSSMGTSYANGVGYCSTTVMNQTLYLTFDQVNAD